MEMGQSNSREVQNYNMSETAISYNGGEVIGEVVMAFMAGFPPAIQDAGLQVLEEHGISNIEAGRYYPLGSFLNAMQSVSDRFGDEMLYRIGTEIAANAVLPPNVSSLMSSLSSIDQAYQMNHRNGEIGRYDFQDLGKENGLRRAKMICTNPYPSAFDRGVIDGFSRRFKPNDAIDVIVRLDTSSPTRKNGENSCTFLISWG
jgi:hypothetical protein